jgi:hypothetical protein
VVARIDLEQARQVGLIRPISSVLIRSSSVIPAGKVFVVAGQATPRADGSRPAGRLGKHGQVLRVAIRTDRVTSLRVV